MYKVVKKVIAKYCEREIVEASDVEKEHLDRYGENESFDDRDVIAVKFLYCCCDEDEDPDETNWYLNPNFAATKELFPPSKIEDIADEISLSDYEELENAYNESIDKENGVFDVSVNIFPVYRLSNEFPPELILLAVDSEDDIMGSFADQCLEHPEFGALSDIEKFELYLKIMN